MSTVTRLIGEALDAIRARNHYRVLRPVATLKRGRVERDGDTLLEFSINDYLGL